VSTNEQSQSGFDRAADGAAQFIRGMSTDLYATFMNVAYGNGQAVPPAYVTNHTSAAQIEGISNMVGGTLEALQEQLMDRGQEGQELQFHRGQERGR
jgi:hypothetical protein